MTKGRVHGPSIRRAAPAAKSRGAFRMIPVAFGALRRWWSAGRHYRPERRYLRGGALPNAAQASAGR